jgi:fructose-1,6-bisphosphatase-3
VRDLEYLRLLGMQYPNARSAGAEIINLQAVCSLPKGTEYFFSDIHGEYQSFIRLLRSSSGIIRAKMDETFGDKISASDKKELEDLIYDPDKTLQEAHAEGTDTDEWQKETIRRLVSLAKNVGRKYTRSSVRRRMPQAYAHAIDELLHEDSSEHDKKYYYGEILNGIVGIDAGKDFIKALCGLIHNLTIDTLHIIGDIYDRGPRADIIMDELMNFHDVDIQWGNHDVLWMGAAAGNEACMCNVLRIAFSYNSFDVLEDGYGINLRPLSTFASTVYADDPCERFRVHLLDYNKYDDISTDLAAKMYKAISVIQFKLEGSIIKRHPEYGLADRVMLEKVDPESGTIEIDGEKYKMRDMNFPTINWKMPLELTHEEKELVANLKSSFMHSKTLRRHIRYLYSNGSMYKVCNGNLLYHGCIPMDPDGRFTRIDLGEGEKYGRELLDEINRMAVDAYFLDPVDEPDKKARTVDFMWYLWCGPKSPVYGKDRITTFERLFTDEKELRKEAYDPYYELVKDEKYVDRILEEFGLNPEETTHIINGHVPVRTTKGESPVKAGGKLFVIDGGLSKAYRDKTGIAGYTLIFNSHHLALAVHRPPKDGVELTPEIKVVEKMKRRVMISDTDQGKALMERISDLKELRDAYRKGLIRENQYPYSQLPKMRYNN